MTDTPLVIDLPYPPSVNKIWRSASPLSEQRVYLAPSYVKWKRHADGMLMCTRGWQARRIAGPFSIQIDLYAPPKQQRGDLDNRIKAVLDWLQRATVIANDKHCQRLTAQWVEQSQAPHGARVTLEPWPLTLNGVLRDAAERAEAAA